MSDSIHLVLRGRGEPNSGFSVFKVLYTLPEKVQVPQKQKLFRPHLVILTDSWYFVLSSLKFSICLCKRPELLT